MGYVTKASTYHTWQLLNIWEKSKTSVFSKINRTIALCANVPRSTLLTMHKTFVWPHLDNGGIIYEKACNSSFHHKMEFVQYNIYLATAGAMRGTSNEELYYKLGLESLQLRQWYRKLCYFYKFLQQWICFQIRSFKEFLLHHQKGWKHSFFNKKHNFVFFSAVIEKNILDNYNAKFGRFSAFKKNILKFIRPTPIVFLIVKLIEESNSLQDCLFALVICANTNSNIVFKIH